jgi:hypothetical protein
VCKTNPISKKHKITANSVVKKAYDNLPPFGSAKSKPKQTQTKPIRPPFFARYGTPKPEQTQTNPKQSQPVVSLPNLFQTPHLLIDALAARLYSLENLPSAVYIALMLKDQAQLRKITNQLVAKMLAENLAQEKFYTDKRLGKDYPILITPNAFQRELVAIAVLGYPELVGVWSYTLLRQSRISESSMEPYFRQFADHNFGLVAINPSFFAPDIEGDSFIYQLDQVIADIPTDKKIGLVGFSMGGRILVDFLQQRPELLHRVAGLVLIDPTLPQRLNVANIRPLLDNDTLLIASEGQVPSPGDIASALLHIPKISFPGIHGQMPNKALPHIISFYQHRLP